MAVREAYSGPVEYMVTIQDPSPKANWYGSATIWCSNKNECKRIWKRFKERPDSEYIVSEKTDWIKLDDFRWQYRRTMVDVDEGKWAVEESRFVKDMSGFTNSPGF